MDDFLRYCKLVIRFSFERADKRERMVNYILLVIPPVIAAIMGLSFEFTTLQWVCALLSATGFDIVVIIPTKIGIRYVRMTTPRLKLNIESEPVESGSPAPRAERSLFWRIRVQNVTRATILRCYAQVESFLWINEENQRRRDRALEPWPMPGHDLPWARQSGGRFERDIGPGDVAYIDYAMKAGRGALFTIPTHPNSSDERPSYNAFALPVGVYEMTLVVTARMIEMEASRIRFVFNFEGDSAEVTELPLG